MPVTCPTCSAECDGTAALCGQCGAKLPSPLSTAKQYLPVAEAVRRKPTAKAERPRSNILLMVGFLFVLVLFGAGIFAIGVYADESGPKEIKPTAVADNPNLKPFDRAPVAGAGLPQAPAAGWPTYVDAVNGFSFESPVPPERVEKTGDGTTITSWTAVTADGGKFVVLVSDLGGRVPKGDLPPEFWKRMADRYAESFPALGKEVERRPVRFADRAAFEFLYAKGDSQNRLVMLLHDTHIYLLLSAGVGEKRDDFFRSFKLTR